MSTSPSKAWAIKADEKFIKQPSQLSPRRFPFKSSFYDTHELTLAAKVRQTTEIVTGINPKLRGRNEWDGKRPAMISKDKCFLVKGLWPSRFDDSSVSLCWKLVSWKKGFLHVISPPSGAFHHSSNNKKEIVVFTFTIFHTDKKKHKDSKNVNKIYIKKRENRTKPWYEIV